MRLAGWMSAVDARSASFNITRGEKLLKPAPRSGSITMTWAMRNAASPSSKLSPIFRLMASSKAASTHTVPGSGALATLTSPDALAVLFKRNWPRSGYALLTALTPTKRVAPPLSSGARPMLGKLVVVATFKPSSRAFSVKDAGTGWSLETMASPPSNCRASRARPWLMRSAKKPTAVSAATAKVTATTNKRSSPARKSRVN